MARLVEIQSDSFQWDCEAHYSFIALQDHLHLYQI